MIQRRQTIYMLLTVIISALLFFIPLAWFNDGTNVMRFTIFGIDNPVEAITLSKSYTWPLIVLTVLMTVLPLYTIFIYKKRELQVRLCHLNMLLNVVFIGLVFLYYESDLLEIIKAVEGDVYELDVAYFFGMAIPLVNLILDILAIRGIKKDIELLKSVDRLRQDSVISTELNKSLQQIFVSGLKNFTLCRLIYKDSNVDNKTEINISDLPAGSYIIKFISGDKVYTRKFVKR